MGMFPCERDASEQRLLEYEDLLHAISPPITDEETGMLVRLFGTDNCYGLAWTVVHLLETAPSWPIDKLLEQQEYLFSVLSASRGRSVP